MEGWLAAEVGDTAGAIRAHQLYLALRFDPETQFEAEADEVRAELAQLLGAPGPQGGWDFGIPGFRDWWLRL